MKPLITLLIYFISINVSGQDKSLPYYEVPEAPKDFSGGAMVARMVDGLGFRFYWATEGLRSSDLSYKPNADARTCEQTIEHIYEMSFIIANAATKNPNVPGQNKKASFDEMRKQTLENLQIASSLFRTYQNNKMSELKITFQQGGKSADYPFWNLLNGPLADCVWHVGQVVSFRRSSGNPFNEKVNLFTGKLDK